MLLIGNAGDGALPTAAPPAGPFLLLRKPTAPPWLAERVDALLADAVPAGG